MVPRKLLGTLAGVATGPATPMVPGADLVLRLLNPKTCSSSVVSNSLVRSWRVSKTAAAPAPALSRPPKLSKLQNILTTHRKRLREPESAQEMPQPTMDLPDMSSRFEQPSSRSEQPRSSVPVPPEQCARSVPAEPRRTKSRSANEMLEDIKHLTWVCFLSGSSSPRTCPGS
eukprot:5872871-Amphidinium_carterae.2